MHKNTDFGKFNIFLFDQMWYVMQTNSYFSYLFSNYEKSGN